MTINWNRKYEKKFRFIDNKLNWKQIKNQMIKIEGKITRIQSIQLKTW